MKWLSLAFGLSCLTIIQAPLAEEGLPHRHAEQLYKKCLADGWARQKAWLKRKDQKLPELSDEEAPYFKVFFEGGYSPLARAAVNSCNSILYKVEFPSVDRAYKDNLVARYGAEIDAEAKQLDVGLWKICSNAEYDHWPSQISSPLVRKYIRERCPVLKPVLNK